jgi:hypothetical protein
MMPMRATAPAGYALARGSRAGGDIVEVRRVTDRVVMTFEPQTLSLGERSGRTRLSSHLDLTDSHASRRFLPAREGLIHELE